jgi:hypothetical protein
MRDDEIFETDLQEIVADLEGEVFGETDEMAIDAGELDGEEELDEILAGEARAPATRGGAANVRAAIERQRRRSAGFARAVRGLAPYVRRRGSRFTLGIPRGSAGQFASRLGVKARGVEILARSAALRPSQRGAVMARELDMETVGGASCPGRRAFTTHWWGFRVWLNECQVKALLGGMKAGAGAAAVCAAADLEPFGKVACGIVAGLFAIGGGVIEGIDGLGGNRGIVVSKPWLPIAPPVVWHQ